MSGTTLAGFLLLVTAARCFPSDVYVVGAERQPADSGPAITTELTVVNRDPVAASVTFSFIPTDGVPPLPVTQPAAPGQALVLPDAFDSLWTLAGARGVMSISSAQTLAVAASKYRPTESGGRLGTVLPVVNDVDLLEAGARGD